MRSHIIKELQMMCDLSIFQNENNVHIGRGENMKVCIVEYTTPANFIINVVVQKAGKQTAINKANNMLSFLKARCIDDWVKYLNKNVEIKAEEWIIKSEKYTYSAGKEYAVYVVGYNNIYPFKVLGNGIKTAYMNFRKQYKTSGAENIESVVIIDMHQQIRNIPTSTQPQQVQQPQSRTQPQLQQVKQPRVLVDQEKISQVKQPQASPKDQIETKVDLSNLDKLDDIDYSDMEDPVQSTTQQNTDENPNEIDLFTEAAQKYTLDSIEDIDDDTLMKQIAERESKIQEDVKRAEKEKEQISTEKIIREETKAVELDPAIVRKTVNTIMTIYDELYQPLFQSAPLGILTSNGIISVKSDNALNAIVDGRDYATSLYNTIDKCYSGCIRELDYHEEVSSRKCIDIQGNLIYNYIPNWHIRNIYGIYRGKDGTLKREKSWAKFRPFLIKGLTASITNLLSNFSGDKPQLSIRLVELFTTVFIAEDFDVNKSIKLIVKSMSISSGFKNCAGIGQLIAAGSALSIDPSTIKLIDNSEISNGIQSILAIFDEKTYNGEILFAYKPLEKILDSGGQVGLQNLLLGRDIRGKNVTVNFQSPQLIDTLVIAGSGSGKGVVTLNMLATFIASGCPTVYVDWKPDMAAMLWDLERETGARILAIDGLDGRTEDTTPVRDYGVGFNMPNVPYKNLLHTIPYLKAFQCMVLCAQARNQGYAGLSYKQQKMMFIFDEAQKMNAEYRLLRKSLDEYLNDKDVKTENKKEKTPEFLYTKRLQKMISDLYNGATEVRNTTGRTGNVGFVMLGQQADVASWADGALKKGEPFGFLVGNCSMKLLGREAVDNNKYSMNGANPIGKNLTENMGYFAVVNSPVADKTAADKIKIVKTYLVLNKNDYVDNGEGGSLGRYTGGMLANVTDTTLRDQLIYEDFYPLDQNGQRCVNPKVGFKGLVEYIGSTIPGFNLNQNLSAGYDAVNAVLGELGITGQNGKYSCIEEYLFDCSADSLFSLGELQDLIRNHQTINDINDTTSETEGFNGNIPDESFMIDGQTSTSTQKNRGQVRIATPVEGAPFREFIDNTEDLHGDIGQYNKVGQYASSVKEDVSYVSLAQAARTSLHQQPSISQRQYNPNIRLTPENCIRVQMDPSSLLETKQEKFFSTLGGTKYQLRKRWQIILDGVAKKVNPGLISEVEVYRDYLIMNGKVIDSVNILGGTAGIRLSDIVDYKLLAKKFKAIKELTLDSAGYDELDYQFRDISKVFKTFKNLRRINLKQSCNSEIIQIISRKEIEQEQIRKKIEALKAKKEARDMKEVNRAIHNKQLAKTSPVYQSKVWRAATNFSGEAGKAMTKELLDLNKSFFSSAVRSAGIGIVTLAVLTIGGAFQLVGSMLDEYK